MVSSSFVRTTAFLALLITPGCSDSGTSPSPISPSPLATSTGAAVTAANGASVKLKGLVAGLLGACPDLTFTVNGSPIVTTGSTRFKDGPCIAVQNGTKIEGEGSRQTNGSMLARTVEVDQLEAELKGQVIGLVGVCPDLTFTVNGAPMVTNGSTSFKDRPCIAVQNGTKVKGKGTRQTDGSVLAWAVEVDQLEDDEQEEDDEQQEVKLKGIVSELRDACPHLTFTVNGIGVVTSDLTRFKDIPCGAMQNGTLVEVECVRQLDGSLLARKVERED